VNVPRVISVLLAVAALGFGAWHAWSTWREPAGALELWPEGRARWIREGRAPLEGRVQAHEQWPVTTIRFPACGTTVVFWPDTLCASGRRDLRRWARSAAKASPLPQFWMG
jgi:hypothetical protein